jgi:hypothetical protein
MSGVTNVFERNRSGSAMVLLAAMTPSWESARLPRSAPNPQNSATATATKTATSARFVGPSARLAVPVASAISPRMSRPAAPMMTTLTRVWASSHSARVRGVVASFSKRLPSRWRATSEPTRERGVNSTTVAR